MKNKKIISFNSLDKKGKTIFIDIPQYVVDYIENEYEKSFRFQIVLAFFGTVCIVIGYLIN